MMCARGHARHFGPLLVIVALATVPATARSSGVLYSNPSDYPGSSWVSWDSLYDGTSGYVLFSSFQLTQSSLISSLSWQGDYCSNDLAANPPSADSTSFSLDFYTSAGGVPGAFLSGETVGVGGGGVQETLLGNDSILLGFVTPTTASFYDYSVNLPTPISLSGGTTYFLSIVANTTNPVGLPYWQWMSGGYNGPTYSSYSSGPQASSSRTFTLEGSAVPEPSSLVLFVLGVVGVSRPFSGFFFVAVCRRHRKIKGVRDNSEGS